MRKLGLGGIAIGLYPPEAGPIDFLGMKADTGDFFSEFLIEGEYEPSSFLGFLDYLSDVDGESLDFLEIADPCPCPWTPYS